MRRPSITYCTLLCLIWSSIFFCSCAGRDAVSDEYHHRAVGLGIRSELLKSDSCGRADVDWYSWPPFGFVVAVDRITDQGLGILKNHNVCSLRVDYVPETLNCHSFEKIDTLRSLFIKDARNIRDLSPFSALHLDALALDSPGATDFSELSAMTNLQSLSVGNNPGEKGPPSDLEFLRPMNLSCLHLWNTGIRDLSPLKGLQLKSLILEGAHVSDLSALRDMPLTYLDISFTSVTNIESLAGAPIKELRMIGTPVKDISVLATMPLESVRMQHTKVTDVSPLRGLALKDLVLRASVITNGMDAIRGMSTLERIADHENLDEREPPGTTPKQFWKEWDKRKSKD